ncbi:MAG: glycosyltransferase, partial [Flavobacterium sp.]
MTSNPFISVIIPCYNDGLYLSETIERLSLQSYKHFEIVVVNDGSTNIQTLQVLKELEAKNIRVLHKENGRMSSAR